MLAKLKYLRIKMFSLKTISNKQIILAIYLKNNINLALPIK